LSCAAGILAMALVGARNALKALVHRNKVMLSPGALYGSAWLPGDQPDRLTLCSAWLLMAVGY